MFRKLRFGLVHRYFLSYMLILCLPLAVLGVVMYNNTVVTLQNEIKESNISKLEQVRDTLDESMLGLIRTTAQISIDSRLTPYMVEHSGYEASEAVKELKRYRDNNPIAEEIILHFRDENQLYGTFGTSSIVTLNEYMYQFQDMSSEELGKLLNTNTKLEVSFAKKILSVGAKQETMLAFVVPLPNTSAIPHGNVIYLVKQSFLLNKIEHVLGDFDGSVYIFNENEERLASKNKELFVSDNDLLKLTEEDKQPGIHQIRIGNDQLALLNVISDVTAWKYVAFMPTDQFFNRVFEMRSFFIYLVVLIAAVGAVLSIVFSYGNYRPIRKLAQLVTSSKRSDPVSQSNLKSEIDMIHESVSFTLQTIDEQKPLVQQRLLFQLLKGHLIPMTESESGLQTLQLHEEGQHYFVLVATNANQSKEKLDQGIESLDIVKSLPSTHWSLYPVELVDENEVAIIVCVKDGEEATSALQKKKLAKNIAEQFHHHGLEMPIMGIGKTYQDLSQINRSFIEATAALEYKFTSGKGSAILFEQVSSHQEMSSWYPIEEELTFVQSLKRGDGNLALQTLHAMFRSIAAQEQSILLLKCMCFDIINTVLKTINEMRLTQYTENIRELLMFQTLEEVESGLTTLVRELCEHVNNSKESKNTTMLNEVLDYLHEHFRSYEMGLETLAARFQVTASYLSRFIKDQTGYTFTDYVFRLRLEEVKLQLRSSEKQIKDIISEVGYSDVSNFMRRFKKTEGLTPGEYRKLHLPSS